MFILIGGPSRSGKTTIAGILNKRLSNSIIISSDRYYLQDKPVDARSRHKNWEGLESLDRVALDSAVRNARLHYEHVILEGIFALCFDDWLKESDRLIYMSIKASTCLQRRRMAGQRRCSKFSYFDQLVWPEHCLLHRWLFDDYASRLFLYVCRE